MSEQPKSKALKPADEIRNNLIKMEPQFKMALPNHISPEKFLRVAQTAIANNPNLLKADRTSLYSACMALAQQGMLPDGREASLVCFGDRVTPLIMYQGILKKVRNSGELSTIMSEIVYEKDVFKYWIDSDGQHLNHEPLMFGDRGKVLGAYALAKLKDGSLYCEMMSEQQILEVKKVSRSAGAGPWSGPFFLEMYKKTVIRRLSKRLPLSTDLDMVFKADDEDIVFDEKAATTEPTATKKPKSSRLGKLIGSDTPKDVPTERDAQPSQDIENHEDVLPEVNEDNIPI